MDDFNKDQPQNSQAPEENASPLGTEEDQLADAAAHDAASEEVELQKIQQKLNDTKDQLMRALAETENLRKRAERDRQDASQYAITQFARDLLSVADNLSRAVLEMEKVDSPEVANLLEGVKITQNELLKAFEKHKIKQVNPLHGPFDHNHHQAMFEVETSDHPAGTVVELLQPGYVLGDRLLRPALVGVSKDKS